MSQQRILSTDRPSVRGYQGVQQEAVAAPPARGSLGGAEVITEAPPEPGFHFRTAILERLQSCYEGIRDFFSWSLDAVAEAASSAAHYLDSFTSREKAERYKRYNLEREVANEERLELLRERAEPQNCEREMKYARQEREDYKTQSESSDLPAPLKEAYKGALKCLNQVVLSNKDITWTAEAIAQQRENAKDIIRKAKGLLNEVEKTQAAQMSYQTKADKTSNNEAKTKNQKAADVLGAALNVRIDRNNRESAVAGLTEARREAAAVMRLSVSDFESTKALMSAYKERSKTARPFSNLQLAYQRAGAILEEAFYNPHATPELIRQAQEKAKAVIGLGEDAMRFDELLEEKRELLQGDSSTYRELEPLYKKVQSVLTGEIKSPNSDFRSIEEIIELKDRMILLLERMEAVIRKYDFCTTTIDELEQNRDPRLAQEKQEWIGIQEKYKELLVRSAKKDLPSVDVVKLRLTELTEYYSGETKTNPNRDKISFYIEATSSALAQLEDRLEKCQQRLEKCQERLGYSDDGRFDRDSGSFQGHDFLFLQRDSMREDDEESVRSSGLSTNHDQDVPQRFSGDRESLDGEE